jgi:hypothetical protein
MLTPPSVEGADDDPGDLMQIYLNERERLAKLRRSRDFVSDSSSDLMLDKGPPISSSIGPIHIKLQLRSSSYARFVGRRS